ncbi:exoribonuclease II [Gammaproteobacteria bacterium]
MNSLPSPGQLIDLLENNQVTSAVCLEERKGKLRVLTESGREVNASPRQILHIHARRLDTAQAREALVRLLQTYSTRCQSSEVDTLGLWEVVQEEDREFTALELADLALGGTEDEQVSALLRKFYQERLYFRARDQGFRATDAATITAILTQRAREEEKQNRIRRLTAWLQSVWAGDRPLSPPESPEVIEMLKDVAIHGEEAKTKDSLFEILRAANLGNEEGVAFELLVKLGEWSPDENKSLLRLEVRRAFPPEVETETQTFMQQETWDWSDRENLTSLPMYTVDSVTTLDVDDAISLVEEQGRLELGIHITDVSAFLLPNSNLDMEARLRGASIYLPDLRIPMLPFSISEHLASLKEGAPRPGISLFLKVDPSGEISSWRFSRTLLRVTKKITYQEVDSVLSSGEVFPWSPLFRIAESWRAKRLAKGALFLTFPEMTLKIGKGGEVTFHRQPQESPAQILIAEMMIQINHFTAECLKTSGVPCLYRGQSAPRERLMTAPVPEDLWLNYRQRMCLSRAETSTVPIMHHGLGLDAYAMASSPLRRYTDLINQRQLNAVLTNSAALYDANQLEEIRAALDRPLSQIPMLEQTRRRYWILRALERQIGLETSALVINVHGQRVQIVLPEFMLETPFPSGNYLQPGQWLKVRISRVKASEDILKLEIL